jgi:diguanylate cyclase (GGDEF)-like protein/PAS domain S-box-containing protein
MNGLGNATRISLGLALLVVCVLCGAFALGIMPTRHSIENQSRTRTAQLLATQMSAAITGNDGAAASRLAERILSQTNDIRSLSLRRIDDTVILTTPGHELAWKELTSQGKTGQTFEVPLYSGTSKWGRLEIVFSGQVTSGYGDWTIIAFVTGGCLVAYMLYMKRTLRVLDPSHVVPERVRAMLDTLTEGAVILDHRNQVMLVNHAFEQLVGKTERDLIGKPLQSLAWQACQSEHGPVDFPWVRATSNRSLRGESVQLKTDRGLRALSVNAAPIHGAGRAVRGVLVTFDDVTHVEEKNQQLTEMVRQLGEAQERVEKQNEELVRLATRDVLTGCLNRRAFHEQITTLFAMARRHHTAVSVVMVDVDHFKSINDNHGHARGDDVLREVGKRLRESTRSSDIVCRYGGEEFCILLPHTNLDAAVGVAEALRQALGDTKVADLVVTASVGVSSTDLGSTVPDKVVEQADEALYYSKRTGRNRTTRYDRIDPEAMKRLAEKKALASKPVVPQEALSALMATLRYRDPQTHDHANRVAELCVLVGRDWIESSDMPALEVAARLHDIGKVGVPDSILLKPGPLTQDEWAVMSQHDRIGVEIIEASFKVPAIAEIVRHHHAAFDQSEGGPFEVPIEARLLTIADAYDAMTHDRPYRAARSREEAFEELRRHGGTQFDPKLVDLFIARVSSIDADAGRQDDNVLKALRLGQQAQRVAHAVRQRDLSQLSAVAGRLAQSARAEGSNDVATIADSIATADKSTDLAGLLLQLNELLQKVSETQQRLTRAA